MSNQKVATSHRRHRRPSHAKPNLPSEFLNCYEITNASELSWPVRLYRVKRSDGQRSQQTDRGKIKDVFWQLRKKNSHHCQGYGFVIDVRPDMIAVPESWKVPADNESVGDYLVSFEKAIVASPENVKHTQIVQGIFREALKQHFKNNMPDELGSLWQDYGNFCQMPDINKRGNFHFCKKFTVAAKPIIDNRWVVEVSVNTTTLDGRTIEDYYRNGRVRELAKSIAAKRSKKLNRKNQPTAVRVWCDESSDYQTACSVMELSDPELIIGHADLSRQQQSELVSGGIQCQLFKRDPELIAMRQARLILDSQITMGDHDETIIDPDERIYLGTLLCEAASKAKVFGSSMELASGPFETNLVPSFSISPPSVLVRNKERGERLIKSPEFNAEDIKKRSNYRAKQIRENGFLNSRPVKLLLAAPKSYGPGRAGKMRNSLNRILDWQGIKFKFTEYVLYSDVEEVRAAVDKSGYTAAIVVLPEGARSSTHHDDTHERVKRILEIPSQCIHHDNTLPESWVDKPFKQFKEENPRLARRLKQRYELCLGNLLVKCHWVPFAPAEPFHYNVHVGIDVGGQHNDSAMVCVGHGFSAKNDPIVFRPDQIPIPVQQKEPIPSQFLLAGLRGPFKAIESQMAEAGGNVNFSKALFFRDGSLLGDGDAWNEIDALKKLHTEFLKKGLVDESSVWTAVEVLKSAEGWRILRNGPKREGNPIVGRAIFPFRDPKAALVSTTGQPYLHQGTARPLKINIVDIYGTASTEEVIRDLVWESDMCLSKPDMGMRLPWVLNIADTGALQTSKSYVIAGIPA